MTHDLEAKVVKTQLRIQGEEGGKCQIKGEKADQFMTQIESGITEDSSVARATSAEDTDPLELVLRILFHHLSLSLSPYL